MQRQLRDVTSSNHGVDKNYIIEIIKIENGNLGYCKGNFIVEIRVDNSAINHPSKFVASAPTC
jgi:hypothetical protein